MSFTLHQPNMSGYKERLYEDIGAEYPGRGNF